MSTRTRTATIVVGEETFTGQLKLWLVDHSGGTFQMFFKHGDYNRLVELLGAACVISADGLASKNGRISMITRPALSVPYVVANWETIRY
jgi:hypothetical protein